MTAESIAMHGKRKQVVRKERHPVGLRGQNGSHGTDNNISTHSKAGMEKVMVIGDIGGGTKYFSENAMRGLYHMLKERPVDELPNVMIFNGGILPEIPKYATKGPADKLHELEKGIGNLDRGVVAVKPSLDRIMELLEEKEARTKVFYVLGPEDRANIKGRNYDRLIMAYNTEPKMLRTIKEAYISKVEENNVVLNNMRESKKAEMLKMKNAKGENSRHLHSEKVERLTLKIRQKSKQTSDYRTLVSLYNKLQIRSVIEDKAELPLEEDKIKDTFGEKDDWNKELHTEYAKKLVAEYEKLTKKMNGVDEGTDPELHKRLETKVKHVANLIDRMGYNRISKVKEYAEQFKNPVQEKGELFTRNLPGTEEVEKIARKIANMEIYMHIRDAFGRRYPVNVMSEKGNIWNEENNDPLLCGEINDKGVGILVANTTTAASGLFQTNQDVKAKALLNIPGIHSPNTIRLVIAGRSEHAKVVGVPVVNRGSKAFTVLSSPMIDVASLQNLWNCGINTPHTKALRNSKFTVSSGIWEIDMNSSRNVFTYHLFREFDHLSNVEHAGQRKKLAHMLKRFEPTSKKRSSNVQKINTEEGNIMKEIQLKHKMPSEWNVGLIYAFLRKFRISPGDKKTITELADAIISGNSEDKKVLNALRFLENILPVKSSTNGKERTITIDAVSDVHIGNSGDGFFSPDEAVKANMKRIVDDPSDVVLFCGDIIETVHRDHLFEIRQSTDFHGNLPRFMEFVRKESPETDMVAAVDRYKARTEKQIVQVDDQFLIFDDAVSPLEGIPDDKKPHIWIVSGNHHNKTYSDRRHDESKALNRTLRKNFETTTSPGGDWGIGHATVDPRGYVKANNADKSRFLLMHSLSDKNFVSLNPATDVLGALSGHTHEFSMTYIGDKFRTTIPAAAYPNGYPEQLGIRSSEKLRGFTKYTIRLRDDKPVSSTTEFISLEDLELRGYLRMSGTDPLVRRFMESEEGAPTNGTAR